MRTDEAWIELLDKKANGTLTEEERIDVEDKLKTNEDFRRFADEYDRLTSGLKNYGKRQELRNLFDEVHAEIPLDKPASRIRKSFTRHWQIAAIAASLGLFVMVFLHFSDKRQTVAYQELRKSVDKIQRSQKEMLHEMRENEKASNNSLRVEPQATIERPVYGIAPYVPGKYSGSGFFVSANGFLATSYHVIKGADSVFVQNETYGRRKVAIIFTDVAKDIAILELEDKTALPRALPYSIATREASLGESVYTLGYPRQDIVFGEGSISAMSGYLQNPDAYQISVPVNPGNSGGPLFNSRGDLIGMISGLQTQTYGAAFATKSSTLHWILSSPNDLMKGITLPMRNTLKNLTRVEQVKRWKDFVFIVEVYGK